MRSLSSSASETGFFGFLERALALLVEECPRAHERMLSGLGARRLRLDVDGVTRVLLASEGRCTLWRGAAGTPDVEVGLGRPLVLALLDGRTSIRDAVMNDGLSVKGPVEALVAFHDVMEAFVSGLARAISTPRLIEAYRGDRTVSAGASNGSIDQPIGDDNAPQEAR